MKIVTKTNLHLWLLTGRCEGFYNAALNSGIRYLGSAAPSDVVACRKLLKLDDARSDFYVLGALAAATASAPFLRILPDDQGLAFTEDLTHLPPITVTGATAIAGGASSWSHIDGSVAGREGFTTVSVTKNGESVTILKDNGTSIVADFQLSGDVVFVPTLAELGIDARFRVDGWGDGYTFTIRLAQTHYPYDKFATAIADSPAAIQLMLDAGTLEAFASAVRPLHKVGALACAVMRQMARITAPKSDEFIVEIGIPGAHDYTQRQLTVDWSPILLDNAPVVYSN